MIRFWRPQMHELSICQALVDRVTSIASEQNARQIFSIRVAIGPLSGVEPQLLEQAYSLAAAGSIAEDAELELETLPVRVLCSNCDKESNVIPNRLVCGHCGDWRTTLLSGDELMLQAIEMERHYA